MKPLDRRRYLASWRYWLAPGMGVKRHVAWALAGALLGVVAITALVLWLLGDGRRELAVPLEVMLVSPTWARHGGWIMAALAIIGIVTCVAAIGRLNRSLLSNWMERPHEAAEVLHRRLQLGRGPKIVAIGGGTGLSLLLRGLRGHSSNLTAVVAVSDDGGSSGRLRAAFDMPAPGDLSDCLAALSDDEGALGRLLEYRFERGRELEGHTFGNLLITTLSEVEGDFAEGLRVIQRLLNLHGAVWPATAKPVSLRVEKADGRVVEGESEVRRVPGPSKRVSVEPADIDALPEVSQAIAEAELVILGPGSLFTSVLPPLLVPDVARALRETEAPVVYVVNIMTEAGETDAFGAWDHVRTIHEHLGRFPDLVLVNDEAVDDARLEAYRSEQAELVHLELQVFRNAGVDLLLRPVLGEGPRAQHDAPKLALALVEWALERRS